jgi:diaminopimelate decarboxylase
MLQFGTQRVNDRGHLEVGGCDCVDLAERFGTPLYVLDEALVRENCRRYVESFGQRYPEVTVAYAGKALLCTAMCRLVESEGLALDVASGGELYTTLAAGFPPERIVLHGNYKTADELQMALAAGVHEIVVDSLPELDEVARLGRERGRPVDIAIRVAPGIKAHTHHYIQTGQLDSKFGLGIEGSLALSGLKAAHDNAWLNLLGVHCHIGSQLFGVESYELTVEMMLGLLAEAEQEHGITLRELNLGGGLGIRYTHEDAAAPVEHLAEAITTAVQDGCERRGLALPELWLEPGRSITGEAGVTLYRIGVVKEIPGVRTYVSVDGGLSDNPRPGLYQAEYEAVIANRADAESNRRARVSGRHCETDTLIEQIALADPQAGDILAVFSTGAYTYAMASNYNRFTRPAMVLARAGQADVIVERETYDDLISHDRIPARLAEPVPAQGSRR